MFVYQSQTDSQELSADKYDEKKILSSPSFLNNVVLMEKVLVENISSVSIDNFNSSIQNQSNPEILCWSILFVDLIRYKVVYADWLNSKYQTGRITKTSTSRNKERVYDIDFDDGAKQVGVKEEYIRLILRTGSNASSVESEKKMTLKEGIRVHFKLNQKGSSSGSVRYFPGRITECAKSGSFSIEYENGISRNVFPEDIIIGLSNGQIVEAKKPEYIKLESTSLSWNSTGNSVAASYGKLSLLGWNNHPGAICNWNLFSSRSGFQSDSPNQVLDHSACITMISYHPEIPSLLVSATFNGEVMIWNTTKPEIPVASSAISSYSHNGPVKKAFWFKNISNGLKNLIDDSWLILSCGIDGKILIWSQSNDLQYPLKGFLMADGNSSTFGKKLTFQSISSICLSDIKHNNSGSRGNANYSNGNGGSDILWVIIGLESGKIIRVQLNKIFNHSPLMTQDTVKRNVPLSEVFEPLLRYDHTQYEEHIGPVNSVECSPFHRNLFLTAGEDGLLRMYHVLERAPVLSWDPVTASAAVQTPLTSCAFSPVRPCVWACSSASGFVYIFDYLVSKCAPVHVLDIASSIKSYNMKNDEITAKDNKENIPKYESKAENTGITDVVFNPKQRDFIAATTVNGDVHIWKMSSHYSSRNVEEQNVIDEIGNLIAK